MAVSAYEIFPGPIFVKYSVYYLEWTKVGYQILNGHIQIQVILI